MRFNQQFQGTAVRTDDTVVAPLLAGNLFEAGMDGHGDAVPTVVGGHEGTAASLGDAFIERISIVFMEQARVEVGGSAVPSVLVAVGKEMLHQRGGFPVAGMIALQAAYAGNGELGGEESIFSETLLGTSPARVAGKVGIRSAHHEGMTLVTGGLHVVAGFFSGLFRYFLHQIGVPCGAQTVGLGEYGGGAVCGDYFPIFRSLASAPHGRPAEGQPVQSFVVSATGNVEAGDTEVGGKKVYLFIQCQDGKKMVHALFVGERGILEGLCLLCACLQAKQQRENEE